MELLDASVSPRQLVVQVTEWPPKVWIHQEYIHQELKQSRIYY